MANVLCLAKALGGGGAQGSAWLATPRGRGWPRAATQEVLVGRGHPHVLQDEGDVLPLPQAARDEGRGASHAVLRSLLGHAGVGGHLSHFEGLQLLMAWQVILVVCEVVGDDEVPGQAECGHQENHTLMPVLDPSWDNVEGAEGRNSDTLAQLEVFLAIDGHCIPDRYSLFGGDVGHEARALHPVPSPFHPAGLLLACQMLCIDNIFF